jgi:hypothetical protein
VNTIGLNLVRICDGLKFDSKRGGYDSSANLAIATYVGVTKHINGVTTNRRHVHLQVSAGNQLRVLKYNTQKKISENSTTENVLRGIPFRWYVQTGTALELTLQFRTALQCLVNTKQVRLQPNVREHNSVMCH